MTHADLKKLEESATPGPWKPEIGQGEDDYGWGAITPYHESTEEDEDDEDTPAAQAAMADAKLISSLRNLAPELIALWEAVALLHGEHYDCSCPICRALDALNKKARGL